MSTNYSSVKYCRNIYDRKEDKLIKKHWFFTLLFLAVLLIAGCQGEKEPVKSSPSPVKASSQNNLVKKPNKTPVPMPQSGVSKKKPDAVATSRSWYFIPNSQHLAPQVNKEGLALLTENQAVYMLPNDNKRIYLSFDCGYELGYTPAILDTLQRKQVKAAFFITGQYIKTKPELVKRMQADGHLVCNHTFNHPDLAKTKQDKLQQEIGSLEQRYQELTGVPMDKYIRPPMGSYSADSLKWTRDLGYTTVFWSMAWKDWDPKQQPGADFVYQHVMNNIHPGAIILMHAVSSSDTEALEKIINDLQAQGYVFSSFNN